MCVCVCVHFYRHPRECVCVRTSIDTHVCVYVHFYRHPHGVVRACSAVCDSVRPHGL